MDLKLFSAIIVLTLISIVNSDHFDLNEDNNDWTDFGDMFSYDSNTKTNIKSDKQFQSPKALAKEECDCHQKSVEENVAKEVSNCEGVFRKLDVCMKDKETLINLDKTSICNKRIAVFVNRTVRKLIYNLEKLGQHLSKEDYILISTFIFQIDVQFIKEFITKEEIDCKRMDEFEDRIYELIDRLVIKSSDKHNFINNLIENYWFYCFLAISLILSFILLYKMYFMRKTAKIMTLYVLILLISFVWQWNELYLIELSKRQFIISSAPKECLYLENSNELNMFAFLRPIVKWWTKIDKKCEEYYYASIVDPIYKVNPLTAISQAISMALFTPISVLGDQLGIGLSKFLDNFNFIEKILVTIVLLILIIIILFFYCGYAIRAPFFAITRAPQTTNAHPIRQYIPFIQMDSQSSRSSQGRREAIHSNNQNINYVFDSNSSEQPHSSARSVRLRRWQSTTSLSQF